MKDKAVIAFTATSIALIGAFNVFSAFHKVQAANPVTAKPAAPVESKFGPEAGPLTMKQRAARANHHNLQADCMGEIRETLKDPNSLKVIDGSYGARGDRKVVVNLTYTATNSFGGRVKEQNSCTYTL